MVSTLSAIVVVFCVEMAFISNFLFEKNAKLANNNILNYTEQITFSVQDALRDALNITKYAQGAMANIDIEKDPEPHRLMPALLKTFPSLNSAWVVVGDTASPDGSRLLSGWVNKNGTVMELPDNGSRREHVGQPWFETPFRRGEIYIGYYGFADAARNGQIVYAAVVSAPITQNGKIVGVCGVNITYANVIELIYKFNQERQSRAVLIAHDMTVLYAPGKDVLHVDNKPVEAVGKNLSEFPFLDKSCRKSLYPELLATLQRGEVFKKVMAGPFVSNAPVFMAISPIHIDLGDNIKMEPLYLFIGTMLSNLYSDIYYSVFITILSASIFLIIICLVIYFNVRALLRPIKKLTDDAMRISNGDFNVVFEEVHDSDKNEISVLQRALVKMISALKDNLATVERRVEERTHELRLMTEKAEAARERAEEASKVKSQFLANMSHEIRTPMNAVIGMVSIGKTARDVERKDYCLTKIQDASKHLLGVINDILDMSKIEANKFELSYTDFNFERMLQNVVNVMSFRVDEKMQAFKVYYDRNIPRKLVGDDQRITQVITNFLSNAIKFTPEEGVIGLRARLVSEADGVYNIQVAVTDTGIGITKEQQANLFSSFQQADSNTARKYGGTGLGLAISKNIIEMMGGTIHLDSEAGKGSTFSFTIPLKCSTEADTAKTLPANVNWDNLRILTVDDDPDVLTYFKEITQEFGIKCCDTALSGADALAAIEKNGGYNIYFVDWKMPNMDGLELTREIKNRIPESENAIVILISAAEWTVVEVRAKEAGVDKFLAKPLFPSSIADAINEALGLHRLQQEKDSMRDFTGIFAKYRILLAEDVEINCEIVKSLLEPTGLEIDCATNGAEAVKMFGDAPARYNLIFMDVQMPEMDGLEATRRIRALGTPESKNVPIIAMTANVFKEDVEKCISVGMDDHVGKPLDIDEVVAKLNKYLRAAKSRA
jgi:signal transduction histidine kinase/DNA-binding response OmpR family regulator